MWMAVLLPMDFLWHLNWFANHALTFITMQNPHETFSPRSQDFHLIHCSLLFCLLWKNHLPEIVPDSWCSVLHLLLLRILHSQPRILGSSYHLIRSGCYLDNILTFICRATDVILKPIQMVLAHFFSFYCAIIMCILLYVRPCAFSQLNADARKKFEFFASGFICAPSKF